MTVRVLRVYHAGRDAAHRARERALAAAGIDVTLVVPGAWPGGEAALGDEPFRVVVLDAERRGDVNRHRYREPRALARLLDEVRPDVLDLHEEPFSAATRQWLGAAPPGLPVVVYTAQNVDKRLPPPFHQWERAAHRRAAALYPCTRQAAAVARGKGFGGLLEVLPLGYDETLFGAGGQPREDEIVLALVGRLVPEKGVADAVRVLARVAAERPARLVVCGEGPAAGAARALAASLGVANRVELVGSRHGADLAAVYRSAHVVLVPSRPTETWTEQFGRVIVEAQACGTVVAGYDAGSIPEVGGTAALLAPTGCSDALAQLVLDAVRDPEELERRRQAGLALAAGRTWTRVAERQAALYRRVADGSLPVQTLPRSPRLRREAACAEFGPTATAATGRRPFALPFLRHGGLLADLASTSCDIIGEAAGALGRQSRATRAP